MAGVSTRDFQDMDHSASPVNDPVMQQAMPQEAPLVMTPRPLEFWTLSAAIAAFGHRLRSRRFGSIAGVPAEMQ